MKNKKGLIFGWLIIVLILINYSIYQKESHLSNGTTICLRLAPVDPRSLMQGDYMALNFALGDTIKKEIEKMDDKDSMMRYSDGYALLKLEDNCTTSFISLTDKPRSSKDEIAVYYRIRNSDIKFATNAFFFQEGTASAYEDAKYGVFKVNKKGDPLLYALKDKTLKILGNRK